MAKREARLKDRQRRYLDVYFETGDAKRAAEAAGYRPSYCYLVKNQPAVRAEIERRRANMSDTGREALEFLAGVMRGTISASELRGNAAYQLGQRVGLWNTRAEARAAVAQYNEDIQTK